MKNNFFITILIIFSGCGQKGDLILVPASNEVGTDSYLISHAIKNN
jgi:predicted small lipoprotein YifL|tara:strand:- start:45137 stop:45274 length:138 start_codon:yes stop_codon:yes gene_type:complete